MRGLPLISCMNLDNWLMFYTRRNADVAQSLLQTLNRVAGPMGIRMQRAIMWVAWTLNVKNLPFHFHVNKHFLPKQDWVRGSSGVSLESPPTERSTWNTDGETSNHIQAQFEFLKLLFHTASVPSIGGSDPAYQSKGQVWLCEKVPVCGLPHS